MVDPNVSANYLVVAGGGSGGPSLPGSGRGGGGGGAGGYRASGYGPSPLQGVKFKFSKRKIFNNNWCWWSSR